MFTRTTIFLFTRLVRKPSLEGAFCVKHGLSRDNHIVNIVYFLGETFSGEVEQHNWTDISAWINTMVWSKCFYRKSVNIPPNLFKGALLHLNQQKIT